MTTDTYIVVRNPDRIKVKELDIMSGFWSVSIDTEKHSGFVCIALEPSKVVDLHEQLSKIRQEHNF